jgi:hypothetical protein
MRSAYIYWYDNNYNLYYHLLLIILPIPVVEQVDTQKLITNELNFPLDSGDDDDDDDESPLLRSTDNKLWKNTKSISQRIKAFFYR